MQEKEIKKADSAILVFFRDGENGSIGVEYSNDFNHSISLQQQTIGAIELFLQDLKDGLQKNLIENKNESEKQFT